MKRRKHLIVLMIFLVCFVMFLNLQEIHAQGKEEVYIIPIKGEITPAMASFLEESIKLANSKNAKGILIEISTLGGRVDAALKIRDSITSSAVPVAVYIKDRAVSAGALISIAADTIIMAPGSHMGAAEPIPYSEKNVAAIRGEFGTLAERKGRRRDVAEAMVDKNIEIPGLTVKGSLLDITALQAKEWGYADAVIEGRNKVLQHLGWSDAKVVEIEPDFRIKVAQFLTSSVVASLLLTAGMIALAIELFTQGFGVPGIVGIICFALYFGGGILAGSAEWWCVILFVVGVALLIAEATVPGFGILGVSGIIAMIASLVFAASDPLEGLKIVGISFILCVIVLPLLFKLFGRFKAFDHLILGESLTSDKGFVASTEQEDFLGKTGVALTTLRPSGSASIDGVKIDVVSDGEFIPPGTRIKVIRVEGSKIVVTRI